ncbi:MAG: hypothetical protein KF703_14675 [Actinobacteria bacterium]|nr:hypothetical protein [Actinomycetota bacterium]
MGIGSVLVVGAVGLGSVGLGSAGAQVVPTLEVSPLRVDPQEVVTFTVRDCSVAPELQVGESDFVRLVEPTATGVPGEWSAQLEPGLTDWTVTGTCGDADLGEVVVDVDNPLMAFLPIGAFAPEPDPPSEVFGSDCPDGTEATVTFEDEVNGFRDVQTAAIDARGDWSVSPGYPGVAPEPPVVLHITVRATCGAVTYAPLTYDYVLGELPPGGTTTTTPTSPPNVTEPPPAVPRTGRSHYTG